MIIIKLVQGSAFMWSDAGFLSDSDWPAMNRWRIVDPSHFVYYKFVWRNTMRRFKRRGSGHLIKFRGNSDKDVCRRTGVMSSSCHRRHHLSSKYSRFRFKVSRIQLLLLKTIKILTPCDHRWYCRANRYGTRMVCWHLIKVSSCWQILSSTVANSDDRSGRLWAVNGMKTNKESFEIT